MACPLRDRLERRYTLAIARFDRARKSLLDNIALCTRAESQALNDQVGCACDWLNNAFAMLDEHIRKHCCWAKDTDSTTG